MDEAKVSQSRSSWRERSPAGILSSHPEKNDYPSFAAKICEKCHKVEAITDWIANNQVCLHCDFHYPISLSKRISLLMDEIYHEIGQEHRGKDFLRFHDTQTYVSRLEDTVKKTQSFEALMVYSGRLEDRRIVLATFDFDFIGGSMSAAVGQRFVDGVRYAIEHRFPLVCQALSGGARMQEGLHSLVQMSRTAAALARLSEAKIPYIVTLCSPCMGGVSASLASLGDVTLAEPNALIGFAGPRVIAQTVGGALPEGFQTSEFVQKCGFIDQIVSRNSLKKTIARWLRRLTVGR